MLESVIDTTVTALNTTLEMAQGTANEVPPIYLMIEERMRSGLSAVRLTSNIIGRLSEIGIDTGKLPDGSEPNICGYIRELCEEIIKEIQLKGLGQLVIDPMALTVQGTPPCSGTNILPISCKGIIT